MKKKLFKFFFEIKLIFYFWREQKKERKKLT